VQAIKQLNYALVLAIQSPEFLVDKFGAAGAPPMYFLYWYKSAYSDKFGAAVFCKLWAMFQKNEAYDLALEAFVRWQSARKLQVPPPLKQSDSSKESVFSRRTRHTTWR
jgi:hypothetical protein